jgi:hypothetical protein
MEEIQQSIDYLLNGWGAKRHLISWIGLKLLII